MLKPRLRGAARRAHGSSARPKSTSSGDASHLRQGGARHARLNRVKCTVAKWFAQSTSGFLQNITPRGFKGAVNRGPAKAQRSGFGGERRSSGTTELLPRKAKRRMWSLRRRGTPFSPIFRRATKDGATGGRQLPNAAGKLAKQKKPRPRRAYRKENPGKNVQPKPQNPTILPLYSA